MADEKETVAVEAPEDDIRVEIVSEPEEEKPRMKSGDTRSLDVRDEEIKGYGKEVQDRIKKLRFAFHEERRQKEQKERDLATTNDFAQRLFRENAELKKNVTRTEQAVVHQAITRVDAEIAAARQASEAALEGGQPKIIVASQEKLARAVAEKERLALLQQSEEEAAPPPQQQPQQQQLPPDPRTQAWFSKNTWWRQPGHEERTALAIGVHEALAKRGVTATSDPDLYWKTIESRLAARFPEHYNGNGHDADREDGAERDGTASRPLAVAGGTRSNAGTPTAGRTRVIRLSESQVRLAHRIGLTPEQYAHQLALEEGAQNG
jgi:hypothetical protein